jgi:hypothetical protein
MVPDVAGLVEPSSLLQARKRKAAIAAATGRIRCRIVDLHWH